MPTNEDVDMLNSIERAVGIPFILNGKMVKLVEGPLQSAVAAEWKE